MATLISEEAEHADTTGLTTNINEKADENELLPMDEEEADNFRDILCLIVASILCCPMCPCGSWISLHYHQQASEAYWRGDYQESGLKQSLSVKFLIGQCFLGMIALIIIMFAWSFQVIQTFYGIEISEWT
eukprot:10350_1